MKMKNSIALKIILFLCAAPIAIAGSFALFSPIGFTARNGADITTSISLFNDYRAAGAYMLAGGLVMFLGIIHSRMAFTSIVVAMIAHLSLALGRLASIAADGMPADGLVKATVVEGVLALIALFALIKFRDKGAA